MPSGLATTPPPRRAYGSPLATPVEAALFGFRKSVISLDIIYNIYTCNIYSRHVLLHLHDTIAIARLQNLSC